MIGTIGDWLNFAAALIKPLYQAHKLAACNCNYLHANETTVKVLDQLKKGTTHTSYYWVYHGHESKLVLFDYRARTRAKQTEKYIEKLQVLSEYR